MKALVVTPYYYPKVGGLETYARQLNIALHSLNRWDICVVTSNHGGRKTISDTADGIRIIRLGTWFKIFNTPFNPMWPLYIRRLVRSEKPDVIIAHTPVPSLAEAAALGDRKTPFILVYHASTLLKGNNLVFDVIARIYKRYERLLLQRATVILTAAEYAKRQFDQTQQRKVSVLYNSIWKRQITGRKQPQASTNFLFVGSLDATHAWKGVDQIIRAVAIYKNKFDANITLRIMGDGNNRAAYESLAESLGIKDSVIFSGWQVDEARDKGFLQSSALVVYPTSSNDAQPTVIVEAWGYGVPVIAASVGPIRSFLRDRIDGYLVEPNNPDALANAMHEFSVRSITERSKIAVTAADKTLEYFTWEKQAGILDKLARNLK